MNFAQLKAAIAVEIRRPDLSSLVEQTITSTLLAEHSKELYAKDLVVATKSFASSLAHQSLTVASDYPRLRKVVSITLADASGNPISSPLSKTSSAEVVEGAGWLKTECWYQAGTALHIKSTSPFQYAKIDYYQWPVAIESGFSSWIAEQYPYYVVHTAASAIFAALGDTASAQYQLLRARTHAEGLLSEIDGLRS